MLQAGDQAQPGERRSQDPDEKTGKIVGEMKVAEVAQWQSDTFVKCGLWVQVPPSAQSVVLKLIMSKEIVSRTLVLCSCYDIIQLWR